MIVFSTMTDAEIIGMFEKIDDVIYADLIDDLARMIHERAQRAAIELYPDLSPNQVRAIEEAMDDVYLRGYADQTPQVTLEKIFLNDVRNYSEVLGEGLEPTEEVIEEGGD